MLYVPPGRRDSIVTVQPRYDNFIGGKWLAPAEGKYRVNLTPATAQPICEVADSTPADIELALDAAHAAKDAWGQTPPAGLEIANDTLYGLGAGVWTRDGSRAFRVGRAIKAGRVWTNCYHQYPAGAAFGGYKISGIGRETHKICRTRLIPLPGPMALAGRFARGASCQSCGKYIAEDGKHPLAEVRSFDDRRHVPRRDLGVPARRLLQRLLAAVPGAAEAIQHRSQRGLPLGLPRDPHLGRNLML
jgi:hypothetical protein